MEQLRFLLLEDSALDAELIQATLNESDLNYELEWVQTRSLFVTALESQSFDLILSDYSLPGFDGVSALELAQIYCPEVPFIFVSATLGEELAIETLKTGATDYVLKQRLGRLVPSIQRALRERETQRDRTQVLVALRASEERFQAFMNNSPAASWITDEAGRMLYLSQTYCRIFDLPTAEVIGKSIFELYPPEIAQQYLANIRTVAETRQAIEMIEPAPRTDGTTGNFLVYKFPIADTSGQNLVGGVAVDITERKQAEKALQERNQRLNLLFETASDLLSTEQPLSLIDNLFTKLSAQMGLDCYFNFLVGENNGRQMLELVSHTGITEEMALTLKWVELGQILWGQAAQERCQIVINDVPRSPFPHIAMLRSMGLTCISGQPLIVQGRLLGVLSFASRTRLSFTAEEGSLLQAVSDQVAVALDRAKLVTSLQQQTEQLSQANRIKDEFLAVLSHELRTPLNPILGWSSLLRSQSFDPSTTARALEIIERNARVQVQLIEDLLDVSRILRGKVNLTTAPVDLVATIEAALETVRLAAVAKSIELVWQVRPAAGAEEGASQGMTQAATLKAPTLPSPAAPSAFLVRGDSSRLQQVIWNLLSNAVKFTPLGGRVEVWLSVIKEGVDRVVEDEAAVEQTPSSGSPSLEADIEYAQIEVRDTGEGISAHFLPHVFDYFRQADGSTTRSFGGLGLGLAIARHLIQLHGGTIQADSPGEGQGATFTIRIPLLQERLAERSLRSEKNSLTAAPLVPPAAPLQGLRILVVDDEKDTLEFLRFLLERHGSVVIPAASAAEAFSVFEQAQPDLLMSDIAMPEADGYSLLQQVRTLGGDRGSQIPAIALTAYAREEDRDRALAAGFQKYIAKPIKPADLIELVVEAAGRSGSG